MFWVGALYCWHGWICHPEQRGTAPTTSIFCLQPITPWCPGEHLLPEKFEFTISVDLPTNHLLSKLYAPASLAAMSPGLFITQVITISIPHYWLQRGFGLIKTCSLPPPCCRPSCPAKCARNVGSPEACPQTTALREYKFHPYFNSPSIKLFEKESRNT